MVVLDVGQLRGENAKAAGRHGGGKGHQPGLVDAEVMDAVEDDESGSLGELVGRELRQVEAGADRPGLGRDRCVFGGNRVGYKIADDRRNGLARDLVEHGDGFEMIFAEGPCGDQKDGEAGAQQRVKGYAVRADGRAGLLKIAADAVEGRAAE